jgi:tetraacyldisaccharide 4'-kinase
VTREPGALRRGRLLRAWREGRAGPLAGALTPAAWAYRGGLLLREAAYGRGWLARGRLACPVVSVGNLTLGGTGKTPAVEMVARWLVEDGRRVAIVSRGYGRRPGAPVELVSDGGGPRLSAERAGDEPLLLARRLPGVAVVVGADRLAAGRWAVTELHPDVVLLDDGFQQRRLLKDVEIVCLDARMPWGPGGLFPQGTLREPPSALRRAHLLLVTRGDAGRNLAGLLEEIRQHAGPAPCLAADYAVEGLEELRSGTLHSVDALRGRGVLAFAGIAAPERLAETLMAHGALVRDLIAFPDHHAYGPRDLDAVARRARAVGAGLVVTTEKDAVRLGLPSAPGAVRDSVLARQVVEGLPPTWALRVRLEPIASSSMPPREKPSRQGGAIGDWRRELRTRIDAAARQPRDATPR